MFLHLPSCAARVFAASLVTALLLQPTAMLHAQGSPPPALACIEHNDLDFKGKFQTVAGDFNADGKEDLFLVGSPTSWVCNGPQVSCLPHNEFRWRDQFTVLGGDFTGDGKSDLFLVGSPTSWICPGPALQCTPKNNASWRASFTATNGDYDGDRKQDLFLLGSPTSFLCRGPQLNCQPHNNENWRARFTPVTGDFDGDLRADLFLLGSPSSSLCPGPQLRCTKKNDANWRAQFTPTAGDYNGDRRDDLLLLGAPNSFTCLGPSFSCRVESTFSWRNVFNAASGNFDGDVFEDVYLSGTPTSFMCKNVATALRDSDRDGSSDLEDLFPREGDRSILEFAKVARINGRMRFLAAVGNAKPIQAPGTRTALALTPTRPSTSAPFPSGSSKLMVRLRPPARGGVQSYRVFIGERSMQYSLPVTVGAVQPDREGVVTLTLSGINLSRANFMVVAAVGPGNVESAFSNEIAVPKR
jgi:hypothetical protein